MAALGPKNPSASFYWNDWDNDEALRVCSLAAQGLWMRMLSIAARSPEHGVVQIGNLNCSHPDGLTHIAFAVGRPLQEIVPLIDELLSSGAASLDRKKRVFCRRMVRAAALHNKRSKAGHNGAAVTNGNNKKNRSLARQTGRQTSGKPPPLQDSQDFSASMNPVTTTIVGGGDAGARGERQSPTQVPREFAEKARRMGESWAKPLPEGWAPSEADLAHVRELRPDLDETTIRLQTAKFIANARAQAKTSFDWGQSFRGWMIGTFVTSSRAGESFEERRQRTAKEAIQ